MSTQALKDEVKRMAKTYKESWEKYDVKSNTGGYSNQPLDHMANDNEWSYPAYIMLSNWWNDTLDWADGKREAPGK